MDHQASRRDLLMASLMAALPLGLSGAAASPLNPEQTIIKPPDALPWKEQPPFPRRSVDMCALAGDTRAESVQVVLRAWSSPGSYPQASK